MWNPQFEKLGDFKTWLAASGQIFFSLSVGFGIIINYASYLRKNDDVVLSGLTSSSMNEFFEVVLGGLITIPAAFIFLGAAVGEKGTFALGFESLPNVFALMPGPALVGQLFGFLWFFMLFIAAITSSVSMLQPVIAFLEEGFGLKRHASAAILGLITLLGCGFVLYFSKGLVALDTFDFWVGSVLLFVLALIQSLLYGWAFGIERGATEAHRGAHIRIPHFRATDAQVCGADISDCGSRRILLPESSRIRGRDQREFGSIEFDPIYWRRIGNAPVARPLRRSTVGGRGPTHL